MRIPLRVDSGSRRSCGLGFAEILGGIGERSSQDSVMEENGRLCHGRGAPFSGVE